VTSAGADTISTVISAAFTCARNVSWVIGRSAAHRCHPL
jgi:hypothetical protein